MLTEIQKELLSAPLDRSKVKTRQQSGRELSYIESWHAIAEANRIFGFDGWSRETIYCKEISRISCKIGANSKEGFKVGYEAKVKITIEGVTREGTGHGCGQMSDLFDCIESAAKEAESDAMKRALMTFGNPFGLALYDKLQRNVEDVKKEPTPEQRIEAAKKKADVIIAEYKGCKELNELAIVQEKFHVELKRFSEAYPDIFKEINTVGLQVIGSFDQ